MDAQNTVAMSQVPVWSERKFDFTFPVEQYPNLCTRLRGTPARLEELLRGVSRDVLLGKPGDKWSAQEHAGHLLDLESLWMARVDDFQADGDTLTVADLSNRKTHEANHNARDLIQLQAEFRAARFRLVDRIGTFQRARFARSMLHPRLKQPMRLVDHLYFVAEHDDHHLARIWEIITI
jgi:DinB superfamily